MMHKNVGLIILDGWGIGDKSKSDAVYNAHTPVMDGLMKKYPQSQLLTSGEHVGLPKGQMGNSEVGHLNIGAGRIVYQELTRINKSIENGDFFDIPLLKNTLSEAAQHNKKVHLFGLVSEGGVHSSQKHLHALCDMIDQYDIEQAYIHGFTDGRDCDPRSGKEYFDNLQEHIADTTIEIATIIGRYFAMDRDNRWERIEKAYNLLVHQKGTSFNSVADVFDHWYEQEVTDEFIEPSFIQREKNTTINEGDVVICFNFRTDRPREILTALTQRKIENYHMTPLQLTTLTMTAYDDTFRNVNVIFEKANIRDTLGEVLESAKKTQIRIAETEKYPHVTFFFSGGREQQFNGEKRILVNSPQVATYDLQPEMSAREVTSRMNQAMNNDSPNFFCLNFANPDMVGHTGTYDAIVKAVETVDSCLGKVVETAEKNDYELLIIADHGNADFAINEDGSANTAHSLNPVPLVLVTHDKLRLKHGILADVAPTILERMRLEQPQSMTGESLIQK